MTLAANDAHFPSSARWRWRARAKLDDLHVQSAAPPQPNERLTPLAIAVEHFRQAEGSIGVSIISIGLGKAVKVNPTKSDQIKVKIRGATSAAGGAKSWNMPPGS
jgi:hypothetical protein